MEPFLEISVRETIGLPGSGLSYQTKKIKLLRLGHRIRRKRFRTIIKILAVSALALCRPLMGQEQKGWQFDYSLRANSNVSEPDAQQIHDVLLEMLDRWNSHDLDGYLKVYWKSPDLLVVIDSEQFNGWQQLHDSYISGQQHHEPSKV